MGMSVVYASVLGLVLRCRRELTGCGFGSIQTRPTTLSSTSHPSIFLSRFTTKVKEVGDLTALVWLYAGVNPVIAVLAQGTSW